MPWAIKIVNFSEKYKRDASYEPELHPGVTYKLKTPKATLKIFSTGSITVTGMLSPLCFMQLLFAILFKYKYKLNRFRFCSFTAGSVNDVQAAIEHIFPLVYEFRKKRPVTEPVAPPPEVFDPENEEELTSYMSEFSGSGGAGCGGGHSHLNGKEKPNNKKAIKRKYPFGMSENDPTVDTMIVSDDDLDEDDDMDL